jgi:hypothetical protein
MPERPRQGSANRARSQLKDLETRLTRLESQLTLLRSQARQASGTTRARLERLEQNAAAQVERVRRARGASSERMARALSSGRLNVEKIMQRVEPSVAKSMSLSGELVRAATKEARLLGKGVRAGVRAGSEAFRRSRQG